MKVTVPATRPRGPARVPGTAGVHDGHLIEDARRGDAEAFGALVERHRTFAFACAYALVKSASQSEEIAQEAFITAWTRLPYLQPPYRFRGWLFGIVRNISLHWQRDERSRGLPDNGHRDLWIDSQVESPEPSPLDCVITQEEERALGRALGRVPEIYRLPLVLHYGEQLPVPEIARALGITESNVRQRLVRGRQLLQQKVAFVEAALAKIKPRKGFSAGIMAAIAIAADDKAAASDGRGDVRAPRDALALAQTAAPAALWFFAYLTLAGGLEEPAGAPPPPESVPILRHASLASTMAAEPDGAAIPSVGHGGRTPPVAAAPSGVIYSFDFEDAILPSLFHQGYVVAAPPGSSSRHCITGTLDVAWPESYQIRVLSRDAPLFYHSDAAVLGFDYWIGADYQGPQRPQGPQSPPGAGRPAAITVSVGNVSQAQNYSFYIRDYVPEVWGHAELPLSSFKGNLETARRQQAGDRIREIGIYAGRVMGKPLFIDNIKLAVGP